MNIIKNNYLTVQFSQNGAEIEKILNNQNDINYLWEKIQSIWDNTSPVLFPTVGKSFNNEVRFGNKPFTLFPHGIAKYNFFEIFNQKSDEITLNLKNYKLENNLFPLKFDFFINYKLIKNSLITTFKVFNPSSISDFYFSLGSHPAFKCPFDSNYSFEDYYIEFEKDEILVSHEVLENAHFTGNKSNILTVDKKIFLSDHSINLTLVLSNIKSSHIFLREKGTNRKIKILAKNFPYIAFWKKNDASFLCIEPWTGYGDNINFSGDFSEKNNIFKLQPLESFTIDYTIEFLY